ncbi:hypothetical protein JCM10213_001339 [Rhodosporidiobolus nylandii]
MATTDPFETEGPIVRDACALHAVPAHLFLLQDRLSNLPVELLERIFELVYEDEDTTTGAISRALLPFDRAERFKRVEIKSIWNVEKLVELLSAKPHLRPLVKSIRFEYYWHDSDELEAAVAVAVLPLLPSFSHLEVTPNCASLVPFILSPQLVDSSLHGLSLLALPIPCLESPDDLSMFSRIPPTVTSVALECRGEAMDYLALALQTYAGPTTAPSVLRVAVTGFGLNYPPLAALLNFFPSLVNLEFDDEADEPAFERVLPLVSRSLSSLTLRTIPCFDAYSDPCDQCLTHFTSLSHLDLGEGIFNHATLFTNLRALPSLSSLAFGCGAIVETSELRALVDGPTRHPSLRRLTLDMLNQGKRGYRVRVEGGGRPHPEATERSKRVAPGWIVPEYTDPDPRFSTSSVEDLLRVGAANGVEVEGTAVDSLEVYYEWRAEAMEALLLWGVQEKSFAELRDFLGGEEAAKVLEERGLADVEEK